MSARRIAVLLIAIAAARLAAQSGSGAQEQTEAARPTRVSAIVSDRQGRLVNGLTAKDFAIRDDEVAQRIESATARTAQPRRIALLLDEFHVADADASRVREALTAFVDQDLRPDDMVVVLKPLDSLPAIRLTNDLPAVRQAIATFQGRAGNYVPRTPLEEETVGRSPGLAEMARAQIVLSALRALSSRIGGLAGRPAIVLVSEGFVPEPHPVLARSLPDLGMVERYANRYDVPVYAIDPREIGVVPADDDGPGALLRRLASQTGGTVSTGLDMPASLKRIGHELDGGYLLTYRPAHGDDGKYHVVDVRVARRDTTVRARVGYVSPPSPEMRRAMRAALTPPLAEQRLLRRSPLIDVWSGITRAGDARGRVVVTWETGRLIPGKPPVWRVELKATTKDGAVLYDGTLAPVRSPRESGLPADRAEFDAPAGRVQIDIAILNERGEKIDEDARDLEVPTLKGPGTLLLPPLILATQSAREFREVTEDEDAAPAPGRQFRRTERLLVRVPAYGPGGDTATVTVRLLNRSGQTVQELTPIPNVQLRGVTQFDLPLAPLAPGEYFLQFTATGTAGAAEQRVSFTITG